MDFEQQLRAAFAPCNPPPRLRTSILARRSALGESKGGKSRTGSRTILFGTILMVAAAVAMLTWSVTNQPQPEPELQLATAIPAAAPASEPVAAADDEPSSGKAPPVPQSTKATPPEEVLPPVKPFTVQLLPLQNSATDAGAKGAVDLFFAAFSNELRAVPGLVLIPSDTKEPAGEAPDYQLTVVGGGSDSSNRFNITLMGDVKIMIESKRKLAREGKEVGDGFAFGMGAAGDIAPPCTPVPGAANAGCRYPAAAAASLVDSLRKRNFPEDPTLRLQMQGKLFNATLDPRQRLQALTELGRLGNSSAGALQDSAVVRGAIALATTSTDPAIRAQVWRAMRGSRNPDLVNPVVTSLLQERDGEVRLQAVILLQQDFSTDPRAREALEVIAREESRPLVRALATRALKGEAAWNDYVVASLKDTSRSDAERIEAFIYHVAPPGREPGSHSYSGALSRSPNLLDDGAIEALTQVLPGAAKSKETAQVLMSTMSEFGSVKTPAVTKMFLGLLEQPVDPSLRYTLVRELGRRSTDPDVRAALRKISSQDPDANLRQLATKTLQGSP